MIPPMVSFIAWNRMGLTVRNLTALLDAPDDFELHIIDNNSQDGTWLYLESLKDNRIKSRTRFNVNKGPIYAANYNLSKRKRDQFFITVDNDVHLLTQDWVSKFMAAFETFPEVGLLGAVRNEFYIRNRHPVIKRQCNGLYYYIITRGFVEGCCQCLHPAILNLLGYWSEENCMGDVEICCRIAKFTDFKMGYFPCIEIDQAQTIACEECPAKDDCMLITGKESSVGNNIAHFTDTGNCFDIYRNKYRNPHFKNKFRWKYDKCLSEMEKGVRGAYCASIHDDESMKDHVYNRYMAEENFRFYTENAN